jgi:hypothetical protein
MLALIYLGLAIALVTFFVGAFTDSCPCRTTMQGPYWLAPC